MDKIKVVLLCGGKGTRLMPLTSEMPKSLVNLNGNFPLIKFTLSELSHIKDHISEIIIVYGYKGEKLMEYVTENFTEIPVKFVEQKKQLGTGDALLCAKQFLNGERFMVLNGDDLFHHYDFEKLLKFEAGMLVQTVLDPSKFGLVETHDNKVTSIEEKKKVDKISRGQEYLINVGAYIFPPKIFEEELTLSERGEYEITEYIQRLAEAGEFYFDRIDKFWFPINSIEQLLKAKIQLKDFDILDCSFPALIFDENFHGYKGNFKTDVPQLRTTIYQNFSLEEAKRCPQVPFLSWRINGTNEEIKEIFSNLPSETGFQDELWKYDVAELFISSIENNDYLEVNMSPNNSWLVLFFKSIRDRDLESEVIGVKPIVTRTLFGVDITYEQIEKYINDNKLRVQSSISKEKDESFFLAPNWKLNEVEKPDFHKPERFKEIDLLED